MAVIGTLAVVLASVFYASAGIYSQLHLKGTISGPVLATGSMLAGGVILLPLAIAQPPTSVPTPGAIGSLLLLSLLGTALAQLLLFRVVRLFGARRLSLVTYLLPGFALAYGALILDERVNRSRADRTGADPARRRARLRLAAPAQAPGGGRGGHDHHPVRERL